MNQTTQSDGSFLEPTTWENSQKKLMTHYL